jgi:hypothetical protein
MKLLPFRLIQAMVMALVFFCGYAYALPKAGFYLPDSVNEMTLRYKTIRNLILLPVVINDSITVNLILDTGCRNLVLFGKKYQKYFKHNHEKQIQFSGLGSGKPVFGFLSLSNKVSIQQVLGHNIPIVIVPSKNILGIYPEVHGVIGYEIFLRFEIELNPVEKTITFRQANLAVPPAGYSQLPLRIVDSRPVMASEILVSKEKNRKYDLMIDTGSSLGLLLKTTNIEEFNGKGSNRVLGLGFNGPISGYSTTSDHVIMDGFRMTDIPTGVIESPWHNYASIGMEVLKDYVLVLNYCKAYVCLKKIQV